MVAQALPTYAMSLYLLPQQICTKLHRIMNIFWWGKIKWKKWEHLCQRKSEGGIGFRDLHDFNLALLAEQGWRLMTNDSCLMTQVIKATYFEGGNFLNSNLGGNQV